MDLLGFPLPFRHRRAAPAPTAEPPPGPVYRAPAWRSAAPLQRTIAAPELVTAPARFRAELASWADPSLRGEPAHVVSPDAPSGLGHGLATPVAPASAPEPAPVQRQAAEPARWSRLWTRDAPVSVQRAETPAPDTAPDAPFDMAVADGAAAVELPRPVLPVVAVPPAPAGLVRAEHAPLPAPVARPAVPLQRAVVEPVRDALPEVGVPEVGVAGGVVPEVGVPEVGVPEVGVPGGEVPWAGVPEIDVAGMSVAGSGVHGVPGGDAVVRPAAPDRPALQRDVAPGDGAADRPRPLPDTVPINAALQRSTSPAPAATAGGGESTASASTVGGGESASPAGPAVHPEWPAPAATGPDPTRPSASQVQRTAGDSAPGQTAQRETAQRETAQRATAQRTTARRAAAQVQRALLDSAQGRTAQGESAQGESAQGESAQGESAQGESAQGETAQGETAQGETAHVDTVQRWTDAGGIGSAGGDVTIAAGPGDQPVPFDDAHPTAGPEATGPQMTALEATAPVTTPTLGDGTAGVGSAGSGDGMLVQRSADGGGAFTSGVDAPSGGGGSSAAVGGALEPPGSASAAATPTLAAGVVQRTVGGAASPFTDRASDPATGGGGDVSAPTGVVQRAEPPADAAPGRIPAPSAGGVVQRYPTDVSAPGPAGRRRLGLGAPVQRAVEGGLAPATSHRAAPATGNAPAAEPVAPLVGAEGTVLGATVLGATAEQPASGATGPVSAPWSHTDHDEPTVQRATAVGPLAAGARSSHDAGALDDVVPDAASFGPLLGDVPLTSTPHAGRAAAPPSSAATPSPPATGTPAVVQRTTAPDSSPRGLPGGTSPLQRAAMSRSWSPAEPAEPGAAPVFTGLVGTTTLVADAPAPATESVPTHGAPTGPGTPLQRTPEPAGAVVRTTFPAPDARVGPPTPPPSVPPSVQRLLAAQAAQAAQKPEPPAEIQRAAETAGETTPPPTASPAVPVAVQAATAVTAAPAPGAPAQGSGGLTDVDALVGKLYDPLVRRLKAELRLDRERAGHVLDLRQ